LKAVGVGDLSEWSTPLRVTAIVATYLALAGGRSSVSEETKDGV
jgi:hypothetical protein